MFESNQLNSFARFDQYAARRLAEQATYPAQNAGTKPYGFQMKTLLRGLLQRPAHMTAQFYLGNATSMD